MLACLHTGIEALELAGLDLHNRVVFWWSDPHSRPQGVDRRRHQMPHGRLIEVVQNDSDIKADGPVMDIAVAEQADWMDIAEAAEHSLCAVQADEDCCGGCAAYPRQFSLAKLLTA